jgi:hypothetical protein
MPSQQREHAVRAAPQLPTTASSCGDPDALAETLTGGQQPPVFRRLVWLTIVAQGSPNRSPMT